MSKTKKKYPNITLTDDGYCILTPIYAGVNGDYLSHWQQSSPYYTKLGHLKYWVSKNILNSSHKDRLIETIDTMLEINRLNKKLKRLQR